MKNKTKKKGWDFSKLVTCYGTYIENGKVRPTPAIKIANYEWVILQYRTDDREYVDVYPQISSNGGKTWDRLYKNLQYLQFEEGMISVVVARKELQCEITGLLRFILAGKDKNIPISIGILRIPKLKESRKQSIKPRS